MLLALLLCFLATICLAQNYTHNLIPGASDGIAPSNFVARWVFGEDGWTMQKFRSSFEFSTTLAVLFLLAYPVVVAIESKWAKK
ncbi:hypothetical protein GE073_04270 [Paenibacillus sp. B01]|nr:hypothetical protein GE073_04270 [Paenibacillus sp. B01]